ncbi:MAG: magnesium protoporphyrin IX methyltransferase [Pseudomonadota bacterium]
MPTLTYQESRNRIENYFDRTAADTWAKLTSDAPVSGIRATVRAGRDRMRATLLSYLPEDLTGARVLDAGCGTGALASEAASRGADVVAIDISPTLISVAKERYQPMVNRGSVMFYAGDMLDEAWGAFDFAVAMDSLIHYRNNDIVAALSALAPRVSNGIAFTFAPQTPALSAMHVVGKFFPKSDRSPAIVPISDRRLRSAIAGASALDDWHVGRSDRVASGFYTSQAMELKRS